MEKNGEGMVFVDAIQRILSRVSVRRYSDREISDEALRVILEAGMAGPSCVKEHVFLILLPGFFLKRGGILILIGPGAGFQPGEDLLHVRCLLRFQRIVQGLRCSISPRDMVSPEPFRILSKQMLRKASSRSQRMYAWLSTLTISTWMPSAVV